MKKGSNSGSGAPPTKLRFAPKIPARKLPQQVVKTELPTSEDDIVDKELLAKLNRLKPQDNFGRRFKAEKKVAADQVTFGYGSTSTQARSFGTPQARTQREDDSGIGCQSKEYVEPWDYIRSNYPVTLPLRRPYSGDPEVLNRLEFGEGSSSRMPLNENRINAAQKLGFMETDDEPMMIFLQFPGRLPFLKPPNEEKGSGNKAPAPAPDPSSKICKLKDLPAGFMGKLQVYKSGKIKMKLGAVLFDVSPGTDCVFAEEIVALNAKEKLYCVIGELSKHAVVTPDIYSLLNHLQDSNA